jgi:hypothetical protein
LSDYRSVAVICDYGSAKAKLRRWLFWKNSAKRLKWLEPVAASGQNQPHRGAGKFWRPPHARRFGARRFASGTMPLALTAEVD